MPNRSVTTLSFPWQFQYSASTTREEWVDRACAIDFDDSAWRSVTVPHDWAIEGEFSADHDPHFEKVIADGILSQTMHVGRTGGLPIYGFGVYRKTFTLHHDTKKVFLEFDGVMSNSEIYVNGTKVGGRPYGYTSFSVECTDVVNFAGENQLVVVANPKERASRWYTGAGIYRPVRLIETQESYVVFEGTFITTKVENALAQVCCQIELGGVMDDGEVVCEIYAPNSTLVSTQCLPLQENICATFTIPNPQLWDLHAPHLYQMLTRVYKNNELVDQYTTTFGIRTLSITRKEGVLINGAPVKLNGVCLHHDLGALGAAVDVCATRRQLEKLQAMGVNALRCTHNPASREFMNLCDEMGFLVIAEAYDEWNVSKVKNGYSTLFPTWGERDLVDLIRRDRNHPSVIMWSIGNEILDQNEEHGKDTAKFLHDICHREDDTRYTTFGINNPDEAISLGFCDQVDVVGFNYQAFKYEKYLQEHPDWIIFGSETESTVSSRGHYPQPATANYPCEPNPTGHITAYDNAAPPWGYGVESEFTAQNQSPEILGQFTWTGFDYLGEPTPFRNEWPSHVSYFGIFDLAGIPKDRYYMYKAHWSSEPVVHLLPHWTWHGYTKIDVHCHSNAHHVELLVNGVSQGIAETDPSISIQPNSNKAAHIARYRFVWESVPYQPGELRAIGYDAQGNVIGQDCIKTAGDPYQIALIPEKTSIASGELSFMRVQVLDENGVLCPDANHTITFHTTGAGRYLAADNGSQTSIRSFSESSCPVFHGQCIAISRATTAGFLQMTATATGLQAATATVFVDTL